MQSPLLVPIILLLLCGILFFALFWCRRSTSMTMTTTTTEAKEHPRRESPAPLMQRWDAIQDRPPLSGQKKKKGPEERMC